ncbi:hypothetical protein ANCCAN_05022 [Ancylostoma caninum]|uniref:Basic proline-rich protein-like n=1 Tax=Ancylostoma caninum TaxID=29170 RepID=A0A368GX30_ANCCA|nr:hypothetical protein ANCCAN_05022 [Ancylostoma caninum]
MGALNAFSLFMIICFFLWYGSLARGRDAGAAEPKESVEPGSSDSKGDKAGTPAAASLIAGTPAAPGPIAPPAPKPPGTPGDGPPPPAPPPAGVPGGAPPPPAPKAPDRPPGAPQPQWPATY